LLLGFFAVNLSSLPEQNELLLQGALRDALRKKEE
jgi:hypothetical protein